MAQFALLAILVVLVLQLLSGGSVPCGESAPLAAAPDVPAALTPLCECLTGHHLSRCRVDIVWPEFVIVTGLGLVCFLASLSFFGADRHEHMIACVCNRS